MVGKWSDGSEGGRVRARRERGSRQVGANGASRGRIVRLSRQAREAPQNQRTVPLRLTGPHC